ncbi:MAG: hypothetical protein H7Z37_06815 [Pyrinomonadaceae bacterium]|nr:hypothetical protein [Pyrinomonadaceae bacterium]
MIQTDAEFQQTIERFVNLCQSVIKTRSNAESDEQFKVLAGAFLFEIEKTQSEISHYLNSNPSYFRDSENIVN